MTTHYDGRAEHHVNRKTLASYARQFDADDKGGVRQKYFNTRFVQDNYHSMAFFRKVCKNIGNLNSKEVKEMLDKLTKEVDHKFGEVYSFDGNKMYEILISNPICRKVCEKQRYKDWNDIIARFG